MTKYVEKIFDIATGEETIRPYTAEEVAEVESNQAKLLEKQANLNAEQAAKEAAKQAVLDKLGLSADEVAALLA
jgi:hypothetical protein